MRRDMGNAGGRMVEVRTDIDWRLDAAVWDGALAAWLDGVGSEHTRTAYRGGVAQFVFWLRDPEAWRDVAGKRGQAGRVPVLPVSVAEPWRVTISDVERWRTAMVRAGLSPATVGNRLAALSAFFEYCRTRVVRLNGMSPEALVLVNPVEGVDRPKVPPRKRVVLTVEQVRSLIRHQSGDCVVGLRNRALLVCYLFTGLRNSEIRQLRWGDFSVGEDGAVRVFWTGKGLTGDERPVRPAVLQAVTVYLSAAGRIPGIGEAEFVFTPLSEDACRFSHVDAAVMDRPISRQRVNAIIKACARRAGLRAEWVTTHTLRRTAATRFYEASGYDIELTRQMLNHARVETTIKYINQESVDSDAVWQTVEEWYGL